MRGNKAAIALSAAIVFGVLGAASAALASDHEESGGYRVQTWCDINPACNGREKHHPATAGKTGSAYGYVASPKQTPRSSQRQDSERY